MGGGGDDDDEKANKQAQDNIEIWKIKKLIKSLQAARGYVPTAARSCHPQRCGARASYPSAME